MLDAELQSLATALTASVERGVPMAIERLTGGRNNRVFCLEMPAGERLVLKLYHADPRDPRDRLAAEWTFLTYAWARGVRALPQPLARDEARHAGLYAFVPGRRLAGAEVATWHVDAALDFVLAVNAAPRQPEKLGPGSEACFSLAEHVATVERRVARLAVLDAMTPHRDAVEAFVRHRLRPTWDAVKADLLRRAASFGIAADATLPDGAVCVSPSDFGFHNALVSGDRIAFLDFEYAGRDDPAKLASDFFCQPEVPVPIELHAGFVARLVDGLALDPAHAARCNLLLDAYRVKWACIILNDFLPLGSSRRAYADLARTDERCRTQLARAAAKLDQIGAW
jgi:hypothetical protein